MSKPRLKIPEHLRAMYQPAMAEGWTVTLAGSGHLKWSPPKGKPVFTASCASRHGSGPLKDRRKLARAGLAARR